MRADADRRLRAGAGSALFFCASLSVGLSAFVALAVIARSATTGELADASAVLGISFVTAVVPGAIQLHAAAAAANGAAVIDVPVRLVAAVSGALLVVSPAAALALTVPVLCIVLLTVQFGLACHVAVHRGTAIGCQDHRRVSASLGADAGVRLVAGIGLGVAFGAVGLAAALTLGTLAAAVVGRSRVTARSGGSGREIVAPALTVGVLMLLVNLDVLAAPRVLGARAADAYAVAELPAKGIFFVLFAVSWLAVPLAARGGRTRELLAPVAVVLCLGALATSALALARPVLPAVFDGPEPASFLLVTLGMAMTAAAALATALSTATARGTPRPWTASLVVTLGLAATIVLVGPDDSQLAVMMLVALCLALAGTVRVLLQPSRSGVRVQRVTQYTASS